MVHRLLTRYQDGGRSANKNHYEELCEHCSDMEQIAQNAERDSIKYKMVEFMGEFVGEEFDAHISGVQSYGIYCEIDENHCEGLVPIRDPRWERPRRSTTTSACSSPAPPRPTPIRAGRKW